MGATKFTKWHVRMCVTTITQAQHKISYHPEIENHRTLPAGKRPAIVLFDLAAAAVITENA